MNSDIMHFDKNITEGFGRKPFLFSHSLAAHPLFQLSQLADLGRAMCAAERAGRTRDARVIVKMAEPADVELRHISMEDRITKAFSEIDGRSLGSWIKLSSANELSSAYDDILQRAIREVLIHVDVLSSEITWSGLTIFIASPGVLTPRHNDHEQNFLLQILGEKDVCLDDANDPFLLTQATIEEFYAGDAMAAGYRNEYEGRGTTYHLEPGLGVHHPSLAPHSVTNGPNVSVSVSVSFSTQSMDDHGRVHQANWVLRRMGVEPRAPDLSRIEDRLKAGALRCISKPRKAYEDLFSGIARIRGPARRIRKLLSGAR